MALSDPKIRNAKPDSRQYKIYDEKGLFLIVSPNGGKWWRYKYRFGGKQKELSLGIYPDVSLKKARDRRDAMRTQIADGIDPGLERKAVKLAENGAESLEYVAREWHSHQLAKWTESHAVRVMYRLEKDIFPSLGHRPINQITPPELLAAMRRIESRGVIETAHRALQVSGQVFRYAVATGRAERNIALDLKGALQAQKVKHHPAITEPKAIGELMRAIHGYGGNFVIASALKLAPLVFVRPGELRQAEWTEVDIDQAEWRIPAEKMKMRDPHIVPLSTQAIEIIEALRPLTGRGKYLFPSVRTNKRPISNNTINATLRRIGYGKDEMTGHGFRSMASTRLNEMGWNRDAIERQLAHSERNSVRAAYNYAEHLPERRKMMQEWANYLDGLQAGADIIPIKKGA